MQHVRFPFSWALSIALIGCVVGVAFLLILISVEEFWYAFALSFLSPFVLILSFGVGFLDYWKPHERYGKNSSYEGHIWHITFLYAVLLSFVIGFGGTIVYLA